MTKSSDFCYCLQIPLSVNGLYRVQHVSGVNRLIICTRFETIIQLTARLTDRKCICSYLDTQFIVLVIFQTKMSNIPLFHHLNNEDLLPFFVLCDHKLNIFGFWTVGRIKQTMMISQRSKDISIY